MVLTNKELADMYIKYKQQVKIIIKANLFMILISTLKAKSTYPS